MTPHDLLAEVALANQTFLAVADIAPLVARIPPGKDPLRAVADALTERILLSPLGTRLRGHAGSFVRGSSGALAPDEVDGFVNEVVESVFGTWQRAHLETGERPTLNDAYFVTAVRYACLARKLQRRPANFSDLASLDRDEQPRVDVPVPDPLASAGGAVDHDRRVELLARLREFLPLISSPRRRAPFILADLYQLETSTALWVLGKTDRVDFDWHRSNARRGLRGHFEKRCGGLHRAREAYLGLPDTDPVARIHYVLPRNENETLSLTLRDVASSVDGVTATIGVGRSPENDARLETAWALALLRDGDEVVRSRPFPVRWTDSTTQRRSARIEFALVEGEPTRGSIEALWLFEGEWLGLLDL